MLVLAPNDKQQLEPMLSKIGALPEELGEPETLLADTGYFSAANVEACELPQAFSVSIKRSCSARVLRTDKRRRRLW